MNNSKTRIDTVDTGMSLRAQRLAALKATGKVPKSSSDKIMEKRNDGAVMVLDDDYPAAGSSSKQKKGKKSLFMEDKKAGAVILDGDAQIISVNSAGDKKRRKKNKNAGSAVIITDDPDIDLPPSFSANDPKLRSQANPIDVAKQQKKEKERQAQQQQAAAIAQQNSMQNWAAQQQLAAQQQQQMAIGGGMTVVTQPRMTVGQMGLQQLRSSPNTMAAATPQQVYTPNVIVQQQPQRVVATNIGMVAVGGVVQQQPPLPAANIDSPPPWQKKKELQAAAARARGSSNPPSSERRSLQQQGVNADNRMSASPQPPLPNYQSGGILAGSGKSGGGRGNDSKGGKSDGKGRIDGKGSVRLRGKGKDSNGKGGKGRDRDDRKGGKGGSKDGKGKGKGGKSGRSRYSDADAEPDYESYPRNNGGYRETPERDRQSRDRRQSGTPDRGGRKGGKKGGGRWQQHDRYEGKRDRLRGVLDSVGAAGSGQRPQSQSFPGYDNTVQRAANFLGQREPSPNQVGLLQFTDQTPLGAAEPQRNSAPPLPTQPPLPSGPPDTNSMTPEEFEAYRVACWQQYFAAGGQVDGDGDASGSHQDQSAVSNQDRENDIHSALLGL